MHRHPDNACYKARPRKNWRPVVNHLVASYQAHRYTRTERIVRTQPDLRAIVNEITNSSRCRRSQDYGTGDLPDADRDKLKRVIRRAHDDNKPIRFWAIPDVPNAWKQLRKAGVDIINTDKVAEATAFSNRTEFSAKFSEFSSFATRQIRVL